MQNDNLGEYYQQRLNNLSAAQKKALQEQLGITPASTKGKLFACVSTVHKELIDTAELKALLQAKLPEHFVPQVFRQVQGLPRTSAGKIDRQQAPSFAWQDLPEIQDDTFDIFGGSEYVAPTNETEKLLASIWSDVLGTDNISIFDEFLEVGGDSLLSIRILSRISKTGLNIATEDFFAYPTIAGQAKAIISASQDSYDEGSTKGVFPLIPIQQWLFERVSPYPKQWNQSLLISTQETLDFESLERAWQKVLLQHDSLRSVFSKSDSGEWQQRYAPIKATLPLQHIDCCEVDENTQRALCKEYCQELNQSMELHDGDLARLAFFETAPGSANVLAIVVHHLIIDAESWRILLEDLQQFWQEFAFGKTPSTNRKTTSFKHWANKLKDYAQSDALFDEIPFWQAQASQLTIPYDFEACGEDNNEASCEVMSLVIDEEMSAFILHHLPKSLHVSVKDILIFTLVTSLQNWLNTDEVVIDIEGHGREALFENVNISRTIGWFTTVFPVLFKRVPNGVLPSTILNVSKTLNDIPNNGIGHGLLRENRQDSDLKQQRHSPVCFNYLGQTESADTTSLENDFVVFENNIGQPRSPECLRAFALEVNAIIEQEKLHVDFSYSRNLHKADSISDLLNEYQQTLKTLLTIDSTAVSDDEDDDLFDLSDLGSSDIDAITKALTGGQ